MKPIGEHNLASFSRQTAAEIADWLAVALDTFTIPEIGDAAFSPLSDDSSRSDTLASAIERALARTNARTRRSFAQALETTVATWRADDRDAWALLIELAWRIQASGAIDRLELRASDSFLETLIGSDRRLFSNILTFSRQSLIYGDSVGASFIRRLIRYPLFEDSQARVTLMSLCERDPRHWTDHFAALRAQLHRQAVKLGIDKGDEQVDRFYKGLAIFLKDAVGIEITAKRLNALYLTNGVDPDQPSDNWFLNTLDDVYTIKLTVDHLWISTPDAPDNMIGVRNFSYVTTTGFASTSGNLMDPRVALGSERAPIPVMFDA